MLYEMNKSPPCEKEGSDCRQTVSCLPLTREVARLCHDGGRENALIEDFPTTPQSPAVTAPLTRGAKIDFVYKLSPPYQKEGLKIL